MRIRRWAALAVSGALVALPAHAAAAEDLLRTPDGSPLAFEQLAPGHDRTASITVSNPSDGAAEVALQIELTTDDENGCLRQETFVATEQCEADGGELDAWLDVTVADADGTLWTGPISDLAEAQQLPGSLAAGDDWDLDLTIGMPFEAGNDTMTDRIGFDLIVHAQTDTDVETEVLGVDATAEDGETPSVAGMSGVAAVPIAVDAGLAQLGIGQLPDIGPADALFILLGGTALIALAGSRQRPTKRRHGAG